MAGIESEGYYDHTDEANETDNGEEERTSFQPDGRAEAETCNRVQRYS